MKKIVYGIMLLVLMIGIGTSVYATETPKVYVNGRYLVTDQPAMIYQDRTLVPMRAICEALYCEVEWEPTTSTAYIKDSVRAVAVKVDSYQISTINRQNNESSTIPIDVPAMVVNGRTMLPLRAIAEILDADVSWDPNTQSAYVNRPYDFIGDFYSEMAMVYKVHGQYPDVTYKYGFINPAGELTIPCEYDDGYNGGFYKATYKGLKKDGKWGVVDKYNKIMIPFEYDSINFPGENGNVWVIDKDIVIVNKNGKYGMVDLNNTMLLPCEYDRIDLHIKSDNASTLDKFKIENGLVTIKKNGKEGIADRNGNIIMQCEYDWIWIEEDGRFTVSVNGVEKTGSFNKN